MSAVKQVTILIVLLGMGTFLGTTLVSFTLSGYSVLSDSSYHFKIGELWDGAIFFSIFTVPIACIFGTFAFFALKWVRLLNFWTVCVLGTLMGAIIGTTDFVLGVPWLACVGMGSISALISWLFIVRSNISLKLGTPSARHLA